MVLKRIVMLFVLSVWGVSAANAQPATNAPAGSQVSPAASLDALLIGTETPMVNLVKAMPADKYKFAPSAAIFASTQKTDFTGVRTFGGLVIHVAQANYGLARGIGGLKPDTDPALLTNLTDKDQIVAALEAYSLLSTNQSQP
jgi:hypothetical protein